MWLPTVFICHAVNAVCLTLINEKILQIHPFPWCTALFQCAASVPIMLLLDMSPRESTTSRVANPLDVFVLSSLFMLCSSSSLQGLRHEFLPMVIVGKSLAPICCMLLEHIVLQMPVASPALIALGIGALGGFFCAFHGASLPAGSSGSDDPNMSHYATHAAVMHAVLLACMSVCEKRTMVTRDPSSFGLCLYRNALAVPLLALPVIAGIERPEVVWNAVSNADSSIWTLLLCSVFCSSIAGILIFELQRRVSATTLQVANLCCSLVSAFLGGALFHSSHGMEAHLGFALATGSVCLYVAPALAARLQRSRKVVDASKVNGETLRNNGNGAGTSLGIKGVALVVLTFQNSSAPLLMRQSRSASVVPFIAQTGVIMQEFVKGILSIVFIIGSGENVADVLGNPKELLRSCVPALLYLLQNNLQYVAVTYLDAATYTVTYQLKILSTALMSVLILQRRLDLEKWFGLLVLVIGVILVQVSADETPKMSERKPDDASSQALGLFAVLSACLLSGLAGVYTEKMLKGSTVSLWVRNAQLAICSLVIGFVCLFLSGDFARVQRDGFFVGYSVWTIASVVNNSFGGLLIAVVIKYADNILKNFSTAISIILTTFISASFMGLRISWTFMSGVLVVCASTFLYGGVCRYELLVSCWSKFETTAGGRLMSRWGVKGVALFALSFQNSAAPLLMRQSRSASATPWIAQTGVIMQEVLKGIVSMALMVISGEGFGAICESWPELLRAGVPALLYLVQNNLQYVAVTYLDAATYTVTYQLKILSTAVLSVLMLKKQLACHQWLALLVLVAGVAMVQISTTDLANTGTHKTAEMSAKVVGLVAVISATLLSGLAGVYTEKILKGSKVSLWVRNAQLAMWSLFIGMSGLAVSDDFLRIRNDGFFVGYNFWTVASVVNNGLGGLLIAVVIKYADNILKNFSTSISIILTTFISATFMGVTTNGLFIVGVLVVCYSTFLYAGTFACGFSFASYRTNGANGTPHTEKAEQSSA